jgi:hypothetical protein
VRLIALAISAGNQNANEKFPVLLLQNVRTSGTSRQAVPVDFIADTMFPGALTSAVSVVSVKPEKEVHEFSGCHQTAQEHTSI